MLNPAIGELIKVYDSRYQLVLDVAHTARKVAQKALDDEEILVEKPVSTAINKVAKIKLKKN